MKFIQKDLTSAPIREVKLQPSPICDPGYESSTPLSYWSGISQGCECPNQPVKAGSCESQSPLTTGCRDVAAIPPSPLNFIVSSYTICVSRANDATSILSTSQCPTNTKKCSKNICVAADKPCPLMDLRVLEEGERAPDGYVDYQAISAGLVLDSGKKIRTVISRGKDINQDNNFVQNFTFDFSESPCINPLVKQKRPSGLTYPLTNIKETGCDEIGEDKLNYIQTLKIPEGRVFINNKLTDFLPNTYQTFLSQTNDNYLLLNRASIDINYDLTECWVFRPNDAYTGVLARMKQTNTIFRYISYAFLTFCVVSFLIVLSLMVRGTGREAKLRGGLTGVLLFLTCSLWVAQFFMVKAAMDDAYAKGDYLNQGQCVTEKGYNNVITGAFPAIEKTAYFYVIWNRIMMGIGCVIGLVCLILALSVLRDKNDADLYSEFDEEKWVDTNPGLQMRKFQR
eukprot:TRINITY_DN9603_c0_g1_i1.p1 TRINITY_DN9603_c0_g1~~TRINITY_DN9603_c0_g1_i1.p1  ORF type:complete len:454 (+),score=48.76 TRINITY_DN9603_c0_g1_i1:187-1548(+)